jgi:hypothetical protein
MGTKPSYVGTRPACGTYAAYQQHAKRGETLDQACRDANTTYMRMRRSDPDKARRERVEENARRAAHRRLAAAYPEAFRAAFEQERRKRGLT